MGKKFIVFFIFLVLVTSVAASLFTQKLKPEEILEITNIYSAQLQVAGNDALFGLINIRTQPFFIPYDKKEDYSNR